MWPNLQETADLATFTEETLNGKLHFLRSVITFKKWHCCMDAPVNCLLQYFQLFTTIFMILFLLLLFYVITWTYNCKKIHCYMRELACRWLIVENAKIFQSYIKHFLRERNCRILIGWCELVFMNYSIMFLDRGNKTKLEPASFCYFSELLWEKHKF